LGEHYGLQGVGVTSGDGERLLGVVDAKAVGDDLVDLNPARGDEPES
jgi:hypothetical protein